MLKPPLIPSEVERAKRAAVSLARHTTDGRVANLAMQLMSALQLCVRTLGLANVYEAPE